MSSQLAINGGSPVRKKFLVYGSPAIEDDEIASVVESLRSGWIGTGPKVAAFEQAFADYVGATHAIATSSCTAALHLSMLASGVGPGDEVITTPLTFAATANAIVHTGATPVFVDVDRSTQNIDPIQIGAAITPRTKAIVPVHFAGYPCDMTTISHLAEENDLTVIEDAAHCVEGIDRESKIGSISPATCFSFYVTKNITTIEGGMVCTDDEAIASDVKVRGLHGMSKDAWSRYSDSGFKHYEVVAAGYKYNMTDIQAAIGLCQLARINESYKRRRSIWDLYTSAFEDLPIDIPDLPTEGRHALHLFTIFPRLQELSATRDEILDSLQAENIGVGVHYVALHNHPFFRDALHLRGGDFPNASWISDRTISLPLSPKLTNRDAEDVIRAVRKVIQAYRLR